jgi:ribosomal protein L11 methyltransferase
LPKDTGPDAPVSAPPVPLTKSQACALVDAVMDVDGLALAASAHELASGEWVLEATCAKKPDLERFAALAEQTLGGRLGLRAEPVPQIDWVAKSLEGLAPVVAGGFFIHGSHETQKPGPGQTAIKIDAGQAFGTGHHETTLSCLQALDRAVRHRRPTRIIDIGTGTGILAIAAAKRAGVRVLATDNDPDAVAVARQNARINRVDQIVETFLTTSLSDPRIKSLGPFDLVMANILAGPVVEMAPRIAKMAARGATIIVSGLLERQAERVTAAYLENAMTERHQIVLNGWSTIMFERI